MSLQTENLEFLGDKKMGAGTNTAITLSSVALGLIVLGGNGMGGLNLFGGNQYLQDQLMQSRLVNVVESVNNNVDSKIAKLSEQVNLQFCNTNKIVSDGFNALSIQGTADTQKILDALNAIQPVVARV